MLVLSGFHHDCVFSPGGSSSCRPVGVSTDMGTRTTKGWRIYPRIIMAAVSLWRYSGGRVLGGWGPLLCVFLGSLVALLVPLVGVENQYCAALRGIAQLRCQLWESSPLASAVQSTSLTVPFTGLDLLPHRAKPSKGTAAGVRHGASRISTNLLA